MEGIRVLRTVNGMTQAELASKLQIAQNTLSNWENGNREPDADTLAQIARLFGVSVDMILQIHYQDGMCPECGLRYVPSVPQDEKEHNTQHAQWQEAVKRFGFCWPYAIREAVKSTAYTAIYSGELTSEASIECYTNLYKAWFSRSLEASGYCLSHVDFSRYVAMLLNQKRILDLLPQNIGNEMMKRFGKMDGITEGTYYSVPSCRKKRTVADEVVHRKYTVSIVDPKGNNYSQKVTHEQAQAIRILLE